MTEKSFTEIFKTGRFVSAMKWTDLDKLWVTLKAQAEDDWFIYAIGEEPPEKRVTKEKLVEFIDEMDELLRKDHDEEYCGIVYTDSHEQPGLIKIFDPNNLGISCGYSDNPPLPGWVLSKMQPQRLDDAFPQPGNRRRWWQRIFD